MRLGQAHLGRAKHAAKMGSNVDGTKGEGERKTEFLFVGTGRYPWLEQSMRALEGASIGLGLQGSRLGRTPAALFRADLTVASEKILRPQFASALMSL
jgi:hypothetical protein